MPLLLECIRKQRLHHTVSNIISLRTSTVGPVVGEMISSFTSATVLKGLSSVIPIALAHLPYRSGCLYIQYTLESCSLGVLNPLLFLSTKPSLASPCTSGFFSVSSHHALQRRIGNDPLLSRYRRCLPSFLLVSLMLCEHSNSLPLHRSITSISICMQSSPTVLFCLHIYREKKDGSTRQAFYGVCIYACVQIIRPLYGSSDLSLILCLWAMNLLLLLIMTSGGCVSLFTGKLSMAGQTSFLS